MFLATVAAAACLVRDDLDARPYPRVGMLWSPYEGKGSTWDKANKYSLVLVGTDDLGIDFKKTSHPAMSTEIAPAGIAGARHTLAVFRQAHPDAQVIVETYFFEANDGDYPDDSPWWYRDDRGKKVRFWKGCHNMATDNPAYIDHIYRRINAVADATGGGTGLYLDNLRLDGRSKKGWLELLGKLRANRKGFFIMANAGWDSDDLAWVAPFLNGMMYEDSVHHTSDGDQEKFYMRVAQFDAMMRKPTRSMVEVFGTESDNESAWRELVRTLVYTDASFLFADSTYGHRHVWRKEWDPLLGRAVDARRTPNGQPQVRRFEKGLVAWNPGKATFTRELGAVYRDQRTGATSAKLALPPGKGAYLVLEPSSTRLRG